MRARPKTTCPRRPSITRPQALPHLRMGRFCGQLSGRKSIKPHTYGSVLRGGAHGLCTSMERTCFVAHAKDTSDPHTGDNVRGVVCIWTSCTHTKHIWYICSIFKCGCQSVAASIPRNLGINRSDWRAHDFARRTREASNHLLCRFGALCLCRVPLAA